MSDEKRRAQPEHRSDAEKVVKALRAACIEVPRGEDWHQPEGAADALADFVEASDDLRCLSDAYSGKEWRAARSNYDAALARLAEILA